MNCIYYWNISGSKGLSVLRSKVLAWGKGDVSEELTQILIPVLPLNYYTALGNHCIQVSIATFEKVYLEYEDQIK